MITGYLVLRVLVLVNVLILLSISIGMISATTDVGVDIDNGTVVSTLIPGGGGREHTCGAIVSGVVERPSPSRRRGRKEAILSHNRYQLHQW